MVVAGLLLTGAVMAQQRPQDVALQAAIRTETVTGDLRKAIAEYRVIVDRYSKSDRAVAANALLRMADCHEKLGSVEATKLRERVVREFADQKLAFQLASAKLGRSRTSEPAGMASPADLDRAGRRCDRQDLTGRPIHFSHGLRRWRGLDRLDSEFSSQIFGQGRPRVSAA